MSTPYDPKRYKVFVIKKKSGATRLIEEPELALKVLQRNYLKKLKSLPWPDYVYGLGQSAIKNSLIHLNSNIIFKIDIKSFFFETTLQHYIGAIISLYKANIFDITTTDWLASITPDCFIKRNKDSPTRLPTGAPTSPYLSSISLWPADREIKQAAESVGLKYTRYIDDLTFSGEKYVKNWINTVSKIISSYNYKINREKTEICWKDNDSQVITGVLVNQAPNTTYEFRHNIRAELDQLARIGSQLPEETIGRLGYIRQIQPERYDKLMLYFNKRKLRYGIQD